MSNILEATCVGSVVTCESVPVPAAEILSEGIGSSSGLLFLQDDKAYYLPSSALDIKTTIEKLIAAIDSINPALTEIASTLTAIGAGMTGPATAPPVTLPTSVATISAKVVELTATKALLNTLKGALK